MNTIQTRRHQCQLFVGDFTLKLGQLPAQMCNELEPFSIVRIRNVDGCKPRVLPNARMHFGDAFRNKHNDIVLLEQPRACDPALKGNEIRPVIAGHIANVARGNDRVEKVDDDRDLFSVEQKVLNQRKRAGRILWELAKRIAIHQWIGHAKQSSELAFSFLRSKLDTLASIVGEELFGPDQLTLKVIEQAYVFGARPNQIVDVVVKKEVARFTGVVLAGHPRSPGRKLIDFV